MGTDADFTPGLIADLKYLPHAFHPSGWTVIGDTNTGIGVGAFLQSGGGYMEMDIRDLRTSDWYTYELRGTYADIGIGAELDVNINSLARWLRKIPRAVQTAAKGVSPSSDLIVGPGGSLTDLYLGFGRGGKQLELNDFNWATWLYLYVGAEACVGGDIRIMWLISNGYKPVDLNPGHLFRTCLAFAPYYGVGLSVGAGLKLSLRLIQIVSLREAA